MCDRQWCSCRSTLSLGVCECEWCSFTSALSTCCVKIKVPRGALCECMCVWMMLIYEYFVHMLCNDQVVTKFPEVMYIWVYVCMCICLLVNMHIHVYVCMHIPVFNANQSHITNDWGQHARMYICIDNTNQIAHTRWQFTTSSVRTCIYIYVQCYSQLKIEMHRILRWFLILRQRTKILPMGFMISTT